MKVCSLYGAGYYYMPGTDICLKLGGYVRYQFTWNPGTSITAGPLSGQGGRGGRADAVETGHRVRALITVDTRQQTAYGTLRTYILLGFNQDSTIAETTSPPVYMTRGFLQIAGFTFGKATSFFDIVPGASFAYNAGMFHHPDTGDAGKMLAAYTAQFGNGVSGTIALEQARNRGVVRHNRANGGAVSPGGFVVAGYSPYNLNLTDSPLNSQEGGLAKGVSDYPDIVGNIRIDQSWGTWLVGAAAGRVGGQYYSTGWNTGGPDAKVGWAVTTGFILNLPMIAPGDRLSAGVVYSEGKVGYASVTPSGAFLNKFEGANVGFGFWEDGIYAGGVGPATATTNLCGALNIPVAGAQPAPGVNGPPALALGAQGGCGAIQLTTAWSASAAFEHFWTPALRTSWYGSYVAVTHNNQSKYLICNANATGATAGGSMGAVFSPGDPFETGCNPDWSSWNVGSRTQWEPVKGLVMGVDVIYNKLNTAKANFNNTIGLLGPLNSASYGGAIPNTTAANAANCAAAPAAGVPCYRVTDMDAWTGTFRIQRDFLP